MGPDVGIYAQQLLDDNLPWAKMPQVYRLLGLTSTSVTDPVSVDLNALLRALKLGKLLDTLPERFTLANNDTYPTPNFLELVLADEVTRHDPNSAALCARAAGLDPGLRLDTWDATAAVHYGQQLWTELTSLLLLDDPHGALLLGPTGVGKPTVRPRSGTSPCAAATASTRPAPTSCSNASRPPGWTTASRPKRVASRTRSC